MASVFINELHYDNDRTDTGEAIEIAGPAGTDLTGWSAVLYNGTESQRSPYDTINLSGIIPNQDDDFGTLSFERAGIQNGSPDGLALVDNNNTVIQFLSYEGIFTAASGVASGMDSTEIGVEEGSSNPVGFSLQLAGTGTQSEDFVWSEPADDNFGAVNTGQNFTIDDGGGNNGGGEVEITPIPQIQGAAQTSPFEDRSVTTKGIVTAVDTNGFYLQDPTGDGDLATSDALFVFTGSNPSVSVGEELQVSGTVSEFIPGGADTGNLSTTQISGSPTIITLATGNALPDSVILGVDRTPPTQIIDDDGNSLYKVLEDEGTYAPNEDGIDFYESLEGMRVTINQPLAVSGTMRFGEIFTVVNNGANATNISDRGTINIEPNDFNPERVQIDDDSFTPNVIPNVDTGAELNNVTGVVSYSFGNFEVLATEAVTFADQSSLTPEVSNISPAESTHRCQLQCSQSRS